MFRLLPLLGLACLAAAAVALSSVPKTTALEPRRDNDRPEPGNRPDLLTAQSRLLFHAPFSLN